MTSTTSIDISTLIPSETVRKSLYAVFGLIGIALSGIQVGFSAAAIDQPVWLTVAIAVYGFLAGGGFGLAIANTRNIAVIQTVKEVNTVD